MQGASVSHDAGNPPADTVADRLRRARRRHVVGRVSELELVREAIDSPEPPFIVLFVYGPGGVGKTTLLDELAAVAEQAGAAATRLDLREIEPTPPAFRAALAGALGMEDDAQLAAALRDPPRRVLLLDTYESAAGLDRWLREQFLPELPAGVLVVMAGRNRPGSEWQVEPGWRDFVRVISLRNLRPEEARAYLRAEGIEEATHARALELTHGHPLALALFVDVLAQRPSTPGRTPEDLELFDAPDAVRPLLERFLSDVPSSLHRQALEVCAHARFTSEDVLRAVLEGGRAPELFEWLRSLSFVEESALGVFLHDLAREVLDADLRWRAPETYAELHRRLRSHLIDAVRRRGGRWTQRDAADLVFMHRRSPVFASFLDWETFGRTYGDRVRPGDAEEMLAMASRHEGDESARLVAHWLERQPGGFVAFREAEETARGFAAVLALHEASEADLDADPGARAMWEYAQRHGAPRPGEEVFATRFLIERDSYQGPGALSVFPVVHTQLVFGRSRPAWEFLTWADPEAIAPAMSHIDFHRVPEADYEVGGRRYGVFAHDWRRVDPEAWLELVGGRELEESPGAGATPEPVAPVAALSQPEFADAVRDALRNLHDPVALGKSPLMRTRALIDRAGERPGPEALRDLLAEAIDSLRADPRDEKLHRALARTYVRPAQTQELAAEALGVPFSTYRRHRARGLERVTEWLWQRELYGPDA